MKSSHNTPVDRREYAHRYTMSTVTAVVGVPVAIAADWVGLPEQVVVQASVVTLIAAAHAMWVAFQLEAGR